LGPLPSAPVVSYGGARLGTAQQQRNSERRGKTHIHTTTMQTILLDPQVIAALIGAAAAIVAAIIASRQPPSRWRR
jgi:cation transporter-like permease